LKLLEVIEHTYDNVIEHVVHIDNVIEKEVVHHNHVTREVEKIVEVPVYKDHIIEEEVLYETTVEHRYDNYIEHIVEVECVQIVEVPVEVIVERPVTVNRIVEREVVKEKIIPVTKEVMVEIDLEVDSTLQISFDQCRVEYQLLSDANERLHNRCSELEMQSRECRHIEDWTSKLSQMRRRCVELEIEISNHQARKHSHRGSTREKITTVVYTESPQAMELKRQVAELTNQNKMLNEKIGFHQSRIHYGTSNYSHSVVHNEGREVRQIRKSNKNKQNESVTVGDSVYRSEGPVSHHH